MKQQQEEEAAKSAANIPVVRKKVTTKKDDDLDALLSVGLPGKKKQRISIGKLRIGPKEETTNPEHDATIENTMH